MTDNQGRSIDYLRISVTDRCNLRCRYCMPEEGTTLLDHGGILRFEEIVRLCRLGTRLGLGRIKLTGGEPLVRKGVTGLVGQLNRLDGVEDITMTSNGCLMAKYAQELREAGLRSVNISLDTLNQERFARITRRDGFQEVMEGIGAAGKAGLTVKVNCAVMKDFTRAEVLDFAEFSARHGIPVRFIEMMPIGQGGKYEALDNDELLGILREEFPDMEPETRVLGNGPAVYWRFAGGKGCVGFISAVHHQFCDSCNRVRLTSDGYLKLCLAEEGGIHLLPLMRGGIGDEELLLLLRDQIGRKPKGHHFQETEGGQGTVRNMNQIGG